MAKLIEAVEEMGAEASPKPTANNEWYAECWRRMRRIMQNDEYIEKDLNLAYRGKMVAEVAGASGKVHLSGVMEIVRLTENTPLPQTLLEKRDDWVSRTKSVRDWILAKMYNPNVSIDTALLMAMKRKKLLIELGEMGWLPKNKDWEVPRKPMSQHGMRERITQSDTFKDELLATMRTPAKVSAHE